MSDTKKCPYCGEEILAVAQKCKHCGEWLDKDSSPEVKQTQASRSCNTTGKKIEHRAVAAPTTETAKEKKSHTIYYVIGALIVVAIIVIAIVSGSSSKSSDGNGEMDSDDMVVVDETPIDSYDGSHQNGSSQKFEDALREISGVADNAVKYSDGRYIWYNPTTPWGYSTILSVYDSQTGNTTDININKTPSSDDMMTVHAISEHNGKITVILEENRNSNGWVEGTYVWTIDCSNRNWKCVANGVAGAEIINGGSAVKITTATILNPDAPTFEQQYKESTKIISL